VPLRDDLDGAVDHLDGGVVVERRRIDLGPPRDPSLLTGANLRRRLRIAVQQSFGISSAPARTVGRTS
jgi:hypothetical protein